LIDKVSARDEVHLLFAALSARDRCSGHESGRPHGPILRCGSVPAGSLLPHAGHGWI